MLKSNYRKLNHESDVYIEKFIKEHADYKINIKIKKDRNAEHKRKLLFTSNFLCT